MIYAINQTGKLVRPSVGETAICPLCKASVRAKCGQIMAWHWAHVSSKDCDAWSEGETRWHLDWKQVVGDIRPAYTEVSMGPHRADIRFPNGKVIELQRSPISTDDIEARERFYGHRQMLWIFDAQEAYRAGRLYSYDRGEYHTFRWKHARKSIAACRASVYLDTGQAIFWVKSIKSLNPFAGWGHKLDREAFIQDIRKQAIRAEIDELL